MWCLKVISIHTKKIEDVEHETCVSVRIRMPTDELNYFEIDGPVRVCVSV